MTWCFFITDKMRELGLIGNELLIFAVIHGYSANGLGCYYGSIGYLMEVTGASKSTCLRILKKLQEDGLIIKKEEVVNGVKTCRYEAGIKMTPPVSKWNGGGVKMTPNNKIDNKYIPPLSSYEDISPKGKTASSSSILNKFLSLGVSEDDLRDWKAARKGAPITEAVLKGMIREAEKAHISLAEAVRICAENSWRGFRAEYLHKTTNKTTEKSSTPLLDAMARMQRRWDSM